MIDKIEYIGGDPDNGIKYDLKLIRKEYKKLGVPKMFWNPSKGPLEQSRTFCVLSERSIGKTTNAILLGMVYWKLYGTVIHYIRTSETMIENKFIKDLYAVINNPEYGYIEKITDGKYSSVLYHARRWYFCNYDSNGKVLDRCPKHFMICLSIDRNELHKSGYNCPTGDFIIFDEFIQKYYNPDAFFSFYDLHKTIARDRQCVTTFFIANTIDVNSEWFDEMLISDTVNTMRKGSREMITTEEGTNVFVEILEPSKEQRKKKAILNKLYYGFKNPKLGSITGNVTWSVKEYQRLEKGDEIEVEYAKNIYIEYYKKLVRCRIVKTANVGVIAYCTKASGYYKDSIVLTNNYVHDRQHVYGIHAVPILEKMYKEHMFYYGTNNVGAVVEKFMREVM